MFKSDFGSDRVRDFDADPDSVQARINLRGLGITEADFADLGEDVEVVVEGHGTILFRDVSGAGGEIIDASDFLLLA